MWQKSHHRTIMSLSAGGIGGNLIQTGKIDSSFRHFTVFAYPASEVFKVTCVSIYGPQAFDWTVAC